MSISVNKGEWAYFPEQSRNSKSFPKRAERAVISVSSLGNGLAVSFRDVASIKTDFRQGQTHHLGCYMAFLRERLRSILLLENGPEFGRR